MPHDRRGDRVSAHGRELTLRRRQSSGIRPSSLSALLASRPSRPTRSPYGCPPDPFEQIGAINLLIVHRPAPAPHRAAQERPWPRRRRTSGPCLRANHPHGHFEGASRELLEFAGREFATFPGQRSPLSAAMPATCRPPPTKRRILASFATRQQARNDLLLAELGVSWLATGQMNSRSTTSTTRAYVRNQVEPPGASWTINRLTPPSVPWLRTGAY